MIMDNIKNASRYYGLGTRIKEALIYLEKTDLNKLELGKHEIDGEKLFVSVAEYYTRTKEEGKLESHEKYIDIQMMIDGKEQMGYAEYDNQEVFSEYDEAKDLSFFKGEGDYLTAKKGMFLVFFPNDLHKPNTMIESSKLVKKIVVKILID